VPKKQNVPESVKKALRRQAVRGEIRQPDLAALVGHFFRHAGGEAAVARMLFDEYRDSPPGGVVRQRILDMILRATKFANDKEAPTDDLGSLSEDDLERELTELIGEAVGDVQEGERAAGPAGAEAPAGPPPQGGAGAAAAGGVADAGPERAGGGADA
jgi:hypothetical protein